MQGLFQNVSRQPVWLYLRQLHYFLFFLIVLHDPSCVGHMINNLLYYICITYDSTISWGFIASFKITPSVNLSGPTYISFHCFFFFGYFFSYMIQAVQVK